MISCIQATKVFQAEDTLKIFITGYNYCRHIQDNNKKNKENWPRTDEIQLSQHL